MNAQEAISRGVEARIAIREEYTAINQVWEANPVKTCLALSFRAIGDLITVAQELQEEVQRRERESGQGPV